MKMRFPPWQTRLWFEVINLYSLANDDKSFPSFVKIYLSKMSKPRLNEKEVVVLWKKSGLFIYHLYELRERIVMTVNNHNRIVSLKIYPTFRKHTN